MKARLFNKTKWFQRDAQSSHSFVLDVQYITDSFTFDGTVKTFDTVKCQIEIAGSCNFAWPKIYLFTCKYLLAY